MPLLPELERALLEFAKRFHSDVKKRFRELEPSIVERIEWIRLDNYEQRASYGIASADSSFIIMETRLGLVYIIQGVALVHYNGVKYIRRGDVGLIEFSGLYNSLGIRKIAPKKVLALYAQCLELDMLSQVMKEVDKETLVLVDGSAISFLINKFKKVMDARLCSAIQGCTSVKELIDKRLQSVAKLSKSHITLFIAKSSGASFYGIEGYPDLYVLEIARLHGVTPYVDPGFSKPIVLELEKVSRLLRVDSETLIFYGLNRMIVTYMRLVRGGPTFQLSTFSQDAVDNLRKIASALAMVSPMGYPIPLESAHRLSKLNPRVVKRGLMRMGVPIISGREVIE